MNDVSAGTASSALHDSKRRLEAVLDNASVSIFLMDDRQQCIYMNRTAEQLTGYTFDEVLALDRPLHDIIHHTYPDGRPFPLHECAIDRAFPERNRMQGEEIFVHKDGSFYPVAFTASPFRDEKSQVVGTIIEVRDIREEKAAEKALGESRRRLDAVVQSAMDAIITVDQEQRIILFNPAAERMFGCPADEVVGQPLSRFIPDRFRPGHDEHIRRFHRTGVTNRRMGALGAISGLRANGEEFPIEASISQVTVAGERLSTVILRDITERKTNEEARALLAREVDHRAKNALAVAQALVTLTKADTVEGFASAVAGRIAALARAHSLLSQSQWRGAALSQVLSDEVSTYAKEGQFECGGPPVTCSVDAIQPLSLVFHELATNAMKHGALSQASGCVRVGWRLDEDELVIDWTESGGPEVRAPEGGGFGSKLLNQVANRQLHAKMAFDWREAGLHVEIRAPRNLFAPGTADGGSEAETMEPPGGQSRLEPRRVLLVEDEELIALELTQELSALGWTVIGPAGSLPEAREYLSSHFDAAVLDVNLRGEQVYPLAEELQRRGVPFIFCTGYEIVDPGGRFDDAPVVRKPTNARAVAAAVTELIGSAPE